MKTSLAPGSKVVTEYLNEAGLTPYLEQLGFYVVGYGCTTCIGNSGPLPEDVANAIDAGRPGRRVGALRQPQLRGPHPRPGARQLPGLAAAGRRLRPRRPHGHRLRDTSRSGIDSDGTPVFLRDIWPRRMEIEEAIRTGLKSEMFTRQVHRRLHRRRRPGATWTCPRATSSPGTRTPPTSASPRTSTA